MGSPARRLQDTDHHHEIHDAGEIQAERESRGGGAGAEATPSPVPGPGAVDSSGSATRAGGRARRFDETVVLDRDAMEPDVWWFGHLIDGEIGTRGRLRHHRSTHETTIVSGHDGGVYATAALLVHLACHPSAVNPTHFVYDVTAHRLDMRDCGMAATPSVPVLTLDTPG